VASDEQPIVETAALEPPQLETEASAVEAASGESSIAKDPEQTVEEPEAVEPEPAPVETETAAPPPAEVESVAVEAVEPTESTVVDGPSDVPVLQPESLKALEEISSSPIENDVPVAISEPAETKPSQAPQTNGTPPVTTAVASGLAAPSTVTSAIVTKDTSAPGQLLDLTSGKDQSIVESPPAAEPIDIPAEMSPKTNGVNVKSHGPTAIPLPNPEIVITPGSPLETPGVAPREAAKADKPVVEEAPPSDTAGPSGKAPGTTPAAGSKSDENLTPAPEVAPKTSDTPSRPATANKSIASFANQKKEGFFRVLWRMVFVNFFGGLFSPFRRGRERSSQ
jgi:hypothetical protein